MKAIEQCFYDSREPFLELVFITPQTDYASQAPGHIRQIEGFDEEV